MQIAYPYRIDMLGRTAVADEDRHLFDLIEQVLFTVPGERVNRPDFGTMLRKLVFAPNSPELVSATQLLVQGALNQWLGDIITVEAVEVTAEQERLDVVVSFNDRRTNTSRVATFGFGSSAS